MRASLLTVLAVAALLQLSACSIFDDKKDDTAGWSAQRLYSEAKDQMSSGNFTKAIEYLEKLEARYPYGHYAQQAQIEIAYAYFKDDERASAIAAADRFIKLYPNHPNVDYAYYLKGLVNFNDNQGLMAALSKPDMSERDPNATREAFFAFKEVVARFPDSKYAEDSAARMRYLVNSLASHEVHVARYYMKRGAYIAAANRAQYAVKHYPRAPATEEAVIVLVKAYEALGMPKLAADANRIMTTNFPDSKYLKPGGYERSAPWWKIWDPDW